MKRFGKLILLACLLIECTLSGVAQDVSETGVADSPSIVKEVVKTRWRIKKVVVRDTVVVQSDSALVATIENFQKELDKQALVQKQQIGELQQVVKESQKRSDAMLLVLIVLALLLICMLFYLIRQGRRVNNATQQVSQDVPTDPEQESVVTQEVVSETPKVQQPPLDAYNASVYEFITINDHVSKLRRKETKKLVMAMYRYLSQQTTDKDTLLAEIRATELTDDLREQFVSLATKIENFLTQKLPVINAWLQWEPKDGVDSYSTAIRMPEGQLFDEDLDGDIFGDNLAGKQITMVHKMGFYFPGNTISPYLVKSVVSA